MSGETVIHLIGNLTADPELRFTPSGAAVTNFTVASTPRQFDKTTNEWKDGDTLFMRCSIWREAAENVAESLVRGARVIVVGRLVQRSFDTKEGEKRTVVEMQVDEVGPSLKNASAKVNKTIRNDTGSGGGFGSNRQQPNQGGGDPWATPAPAPAQQRPAQQGNGGGWGAPARQYATDEPPF